MLKTATKMQAATMQTVYQTIGPIYKPPPLTAQFVSFTDIILVTLTLTIAY